MPTESEEPHLAYYNSIPWCASLIADPAYEVAPTISRQPNPEGLYRLLSETLHTDNTIPSALTLLKKPKNSTSRIEQVRILFTLEYGIDGYPGVCHGGIVATILDEVTGLLLVANSQLDRKRREEAARARASGNTPVPVTTSAAGRTNLEQQHDAEAPSTTMTAELNVRYRRPVRTGQTVCAVADFVRVEGNKLYLRGGIEDSKGKVLAEADALFIKSFKVKL